MVQPLFSIFAFASIVVAAFGLGRPLLRGIGLTTDGRLATTVFSLGIGLTAAGLILLALGLAGVLYLPVIGVLTMIGCCWGVLEIAALCLGSVDRLPDEFDLPAADELSPSWDPPWPAPPRWLLVGVLAMAAAAGARSFFGALDAPAPGVAIPRQLEWADWFLAQHQITDVPTPDRAARPLLSDVWYLWALAFDGPVCAQLLHWGLGLLLILATVTLATPLLGTSWAWLAASLVVLTPALNQQMSVPGESVALAALSTLALAAWWQAVIHGENQRWFIVAGLAAGGALGIHYAAGLLVLALGVTWAWSAFHQVEQRRFLLQGGAVAGLLAIGIGVACSLPTIESAAKCMRLSYNRLPVVALPDYLSLVLLAAVPGLLLVRRLRGLGTVVATAVVYTVLAFLVSGDLRLLFPAVPLLSVAAVWVWIEVGRFPPSARWLAVAAFTLMLASSTATLLLTPPGNWLL